MLRTKIAGIELENPLMPASGPLTSDCDKMLAISKLGVGAVVSKTISFKAACVSKPCIFGGKNFILNSELWSEYGPEKWEKNFFPFYRAAEKEKPLIISIGYKKEDLVKLVSKFNAFADAFEISTHYVGNSLEWLAETVRAVKSSTDKPFFIKLSPHMPEPVKFAETVLKNGGSGIVAINSLGPIMKISLSERSTLFGNSKGEAWLSGPVIKNLSLAIIHRIKSEIPECPIIGVGGISSAEDVLEFLLAGADAVQMLSAAMLYGKGLYSKILHDLPATLKKYGFKSVRDVVGTNLNIKTACIKKKVPVISSEKCKMCGACERNCPYFAISSNGEMQVDNEKCSGCGLCQSVCAFDAISGIF